MPARHRGTISRHFLYGLSLAAASGALLAFALLFPPMIKPPAPGVLIMDAEVPLAASGTEEAAVLFPAAGRVALRAGIRGVPADLQNPADNRCSLVFEILLAESGEIVYISDLTVPGEYAGGAALFVPLAEGEYPALLSIRAYRVGGGELSLLEEKTVPVTLGVTESELPATPA